MLKVNTKAPQFSAYDQNNYKHSLTDYTNKYVILYFYPKDDTPGCTTEACGIRDNYLKLQEKAVVIGVSKDSVLSHKEFAEKYHLPFTLLSDPEKEIIKAYDADGAFTQRITYLIDPKGIIVKTYPKVNPAMHAQEILNDLNSIIKQ